MQTTESAKNKAERSYSVFGRHVYSQMVKHNVDTIKDLTSALERAGWKINKASVSAYLHGERKVPAEFARNVGKALGMAEQGERELAWMLYKWG